MAKLQIRIDIFIKNIIKHSGLYDMYLLVVMCNNDVLMYIIYVCVPW